jgi:hypothetical protein
MLASRRVRIDDFVFCFVVDSNDVLYDGDAAYTSELQAIINKVVDEILEELAKMSQAATESDANPDAVRASLGHVCAVTITVLFFADFKAASEDWIGFNESHLEFL